MIRDLPHTCECIQGPKIRRGVLLGLTAVMAACSREGARGNEAIQVVTTADPLDRYGETAPSPTIISKRPASPDAEEARARPSIFRADAPGQPEYIPGAPAVPLPPELAAFSEADRQSPEHPDPSEGNAP